MPVGPEVAITGGLSAGEGKGGDFGQGRRTVVCHVAQVEACFGVSSAWPRDDLAEETRHLDWDGRAASRRRGVACQGQAMGQTW